MQRRQRRGQTQTGRVFVVAAMDDRFVVPYDTIASSLKPLILLHSSSSIGFAPLPRVRIISTMPAVASRRIAAFVNALPLKEGLRVLEIGCGPGVAAREVSRRIGNGLVLAIDRSEKAIRLARAGSQQEIEGGHLEFRLAAIEQFQLSSEDELFDIAFAMRVGALDGRHPEIGKLAIGRIMAALTPTGQFYIDGGSPIREIALHRR